MKIDPSKVKEIMVSEGISYLEARKLAGGRIHLQKIKRTTKPKILDSVDLLQIIIATQSEAEKLLEETDSVKESLKYNGAITALKLVQERWDRKIAASRK